MNSNQWAVISGWTLARHYGLRPAAEELDFVVKDDVKYWMGASAELEGEDE